MDRYEYIRAIVSAEGDLRWQYQLQGASQPGRLSHDEDVSDWTSNEIIDLTVRMLDVPDDQRALIEVIND